MRISVLIPSRGRVRQLSAALTTLHMCSSGEHHLTLCVACDEDDKETLAFLEKAIHEMPVAYRVGPRPATLGSVANDLALHWKADVYAVWADDLLCMTNNWDQRIAKAVEAKPYGVFWWKSAREENTLVPIITETWRAAAGQIFTEYFPFWYDDLWLYELWLMTTDENPIILDMEVLDKPFATQRMRDLDFWQTFYHAMRVERVQSGRRIAANLGLPIPILSDELYKRMNQYQCNDTVVLADIERRNKAEKTPPTEQYMRTKLAAAERMTALPVREAA